MNPWIESVFGLWFVDPWLAGLGCAAVLAVVLIPSGRGASHVPVADWSAASSDAPDGRLPRGPRALLCGFPRLLQSLGLIVLALACGRPVERVAQPLDERGVDAVLCLDVSSSMNARDLGSDDTRLEVAVAAATAFARSREDDRLALVRFARFGRLVSPPTTDTLAVVDALGRLEPVEADGDEDATGIGLALARSVELFGAVARSDSRDLPQARVVVLLTDGLENVAGPGGEAIAPREAARLAALRGVRVYTIVVGPVASPEAPSGVAESGGAATPLEATSIASTAELDELRALTEHTGGRLFEARDARGVRAAWDAIDALERVELSIPRFVHHERFFGFVVGGLALLVAAALARRTGLQVVP